MLNTIDGSFDPYDYHVENCGMDAFEKLERTQIQTCWPGFGEGIEDGDDDLFEEDKENEDLIESIYTNGNNKKVKIFNQKCVICLERDSDYAFTQCGHHCVCEDCYQKRGDIDILKCVDCRT